MRILVQHTTCSIKLFLNSFTCTYKWIYLNERIWILFMECDEKINYSYYKKKVYDLILFVKEKIKKNKYKLVKIVRFQFFNVKY